MGNGTHLKELVGEFKSKLTRWVFLDSKIYRIFNNLVIEDESGTVQISHAVVSKFGIFVFDTLEKDGWISGGEHDPEWTHSLFSETNPFPNPLIHNDRHAAVLANYLGIGGAAMHPVVIVWGNCEFTIPTPDKVIRGSYLGNSNYIKSFTEVLFSDDEIERICEELQSTVCKKVLSAV
jgi:hypothetical protein